jgi:glycerol-3-phosphate dehydrogenase
MTDLLSGHTSAVRGRVVVNVAGPWVDQVHKGERIPDGKRLIGGTKGSHLVVNPFPGAPEDAVYYEARSDGRAIFIVPWNHRYLIGTTDIRFTGDLDDVRADETEIAYLVREANALIPSANLTEEDVLYSYSGVRPLPYKPEGEAGAITRKHIIHNHAPELRGLFSIIGGKLTTYRSLAEEAVDEICERLGVDARCRTATTRLPGAAGVAYDAFAKQFVDESDLPKEVARRLVGLYGVRASEIAGIAHQYPELAIPFDPTSGAIAAEIIFAFEHEDAQTLEDALMRRTMVGLGPRMAVGADEAAAAVAERHLGWDAARATRELTAYRTHLARFQPRALRNEEREARNEVL